jgi:hypothetical protein
VIPVIPESVSRQTMNGFQYFSRRCIRLVDWSVRSRSQCFRVPVQNDRGSSTRPLQWVAPFPWSTLSSASQWLSLFLSHGKQKRTIPRGFQDFFPPDGDSSQDEPPKDPSRRALPPLIDDKTATGSESSLLPSLTPKKIRIRVIPTIDVTGERKRLIQTTTVTTTFRDC